MVPVREIERQLGEVMAAFDAALVSVADAQDLMSSFTAISRMAEAGQLACAKRVADTAVARTPRDRDGRRWAGRRLGVSEGQAAGLLELADQLDQLPATKEAFQAGKLSKEQAAEIARTASEVPDAERTLLEAATRESLGELKRRGQRVRAGAEGAEARKRRLHETRYLRTWTDADGAGRGSWSLPPERQAELLAALAPLREQAFIDARNGGRREPAEAYDADALVHMARHATAHHDDGEDPSPGSGGDGDGDNNGCGEEVRSEGTGPPTDEGQRRGARSSEGPASSTSGSKGRRRKNPFTRRMKVIVRVDKTALERGTAADGEICELDGVGPVPVAAVREWIGDDAFVAALLTDGTDILSAVHLGRSPTALQQTVLDWQQGECQVLGCANRIALEVDHTDDWARTHHTTLSELDRLCPHHHWLKTHHGWRLEPGRGKRRFLSPDGQTYPAGETPERPSERAGTSVVGSTVPDVQPGVAEQRPLFGGSAAWSSGSDRLTVTIRVRDSRRRAGPGRGDGRQADRRAGPRDVPMEAAAVSLVTGDAESDGRRPTQPGDVTAPADHSATAASTMLSRRQEEGDVPQPVGVGRNRRGSWSRDGPTSGAGRGGSGARAAPRRAPPGPARLLVDGRRGAGAAA